MTGRPRLVVLKLGGSLLEFPGLGAALGQWMDGQPAGCHTVIVAGGGALAEAIRRIDRAHRLGEARCHWLSIQAMGLAAQMAEAVVLVAKRVDDWAVLQGRLAEPGQTVFDAQRFLRESERQAPGTALPESWDVTSDSIAARIAVVLEASELTLLKSCLPPGPMSLEQLAQRGYVDRCFPRLARELPWVRACNLRAAGQPTIDLWPVPRLDPQ